MTVQWQSWKKSSRSNGSGGNNCVEVAFRTAERCGTSTCVEVARELGHPGARVRDSKDPDGPVLVFTENEWAEFIGGVKAGEFD